jgi:uncharacterized membrane protein
MLIGAACVLFAVTLAIDIAAFQGHLSLPWWINTESADAGRQMLIAIAAAIITTVGVVFSITILALTLASQQFGPRMMRSFIRDIGNQMTLGVFVATFVYAVLALATITRHNGRDFVPHVSILTAEVLLLIDLAVLIYFIHHIAKSIQLPQVIAGIAHDLQTAVDAEFPIVFDANVAKAVGDDALVAELIATVEVRGVTVAAKQSGYLQFVSYPQLIQIAEKFDATIQLSYTPGHFIVAGRPIAKVWPAGAAGQVEAALSKSHVTGPHRTLTQDPVFAIDQLVEIAIRALSPAVNDTFTALTCIDWITSGLSEISSRVLKEGIYFGSGGKVRLIETGPKYQRMVNRSYDKIRQCATGMPAVIIRLLDSLTRVTESTTNDDQRAILLRQAEMLVRGAQRDILEPNDLGDITERMTRLETLSRKMDDAKSTAQL